MATRAMTAAGASVTIGSRDPDRAAAAVTGIERVEVSRLDLLDPASIDTSAAHYLDSGHPLHILTNNAGLPAPATIERDTRGYETQFATNHLGHYQLTLRLHPALRAAHGAHTYRRIDRDGVYHTDWSDDRAGLSDKRWIWILV